MAASLWLDKPSMRLWRAIKTEFTNLCVLFISLLFHRTPNRLGRKKKKKKSLWLQSTIETLATILPLDFWLVRVGCFYERLLSLPSFCFCAFINCLFLYVIGLMIVVGRVHCTLVDVGRLIEQLTKGQSTSRPGSFHKCPFLNERRKWHGML